MGAGDYAALDLALRGLAVRISQNPDGGCPTSSPPSCTAADSSCGCTPPTVRRPNRGPPTTPVCGGSCGWTRTPAWPLRWAGHAWRAWPGAIGADSARRWLLDLERLGALYVTGPAARRMDFARHLAAELAVNSWSDLLPSPPSASATNCSTWHRTGPPDRHHH